MTRRIKVFLAFILFPFLTFGQEDQDSTSTDVTTFQKIMNNVSGYFESNGQWYLNDKKTGEFSEEEHVRANSYFRLNYYFLENY